MFRICTLFAALTTVALLPLSGCGGPCDTFVDMELKCSDKTKDMPDEIRSLAADMMADMCKKAVAGEGGGMLMKADDTKAGVKCAEAAGGDCGKYTECQQAREVKKVITELEEAKKAAEWHKGSSTCRYQDELHDNADFAKACDEFFAAALDAHVKKQDTFSIENTCKGKWYEKSATLKKTCGDIQTKMREEFKKALIAIRDGAATDNIYQACRNYEEAAEQVSAEEKTKAEALCAEAKLGQRVAKAMEEVKKAKADPKTIPYPCNKLPEELGKLEGDWAKGKRDEVVKACWLELGTAVLKIEVPKLTTFCAHKVKKVLEHVAKFSVKGGELDALVAKAKTVCTGQ